MPQPRSRTIAIITLVLVSSIVLGVLGHVCGQCFASGVIMYAWFVVIFGALVLANGESE